MKWLVTWKGAHVWTTPKIDKAEDALILAASVTGRPLKELTVKEIA